MPRYAPPRPAALAPAAGFGNGTLVTLNGSGAWRGGLATRCRFGNAVVNASRVAAADADADADADAVRCAAPPAAEAGAWARVALGFSEAWAAELQEAEAELFGAAVVVAGQLHLTTYHPAFTREGLVGADAARRPQPYSMQQWLQPYESSLNRPCNRGRTLLCPYPACSSMLAGPIQRASLCLAGARLASAELLGRDVT